MNLKFPIKIYKHQLASLLQYAEDCGFALTEQGDDTWHCWMIDHPQYQDVPYAEKVMNEGGTWEYYTFIRL